MFKVAFILVLAGAVASAWALDGQTVGQLQGGSVFSSSTGGKNYSATVLFARVKQTPPIDFEKGTVALSPAKAATLAHDALSKRFPDMKGEHVEEVSLQPYTIDGGQYGFYVVKFVAGMAGDRKTFRIPVLLDEQVVVPEPDSQ